jgi:hypothetical protein
MKPAIIRAVAIATSLLSAAAATTKISAQEKAPARFTVRIENVSTTATLKLSNGNTAPAPTSPGAWAIHTGSNPFFTPDSYDRGEGLESQAEDGNPAMLAEAVAKKGSVKSSGTYTTSIGASEPGPLFPGKAIEFSFSAKPGQRLSLTMMFGQSNDAFLANGKEGIALFDVYGNPLNGDVTRYLYLWDAGSEMNEEPGLGANQAPRQAAANTGPSEHQPIRLMKDVKDGFTYPAVAQIVRVTVSAARQVSVK